MILNQIDAMDEHVSDAEGNVRERDHKVDKREGVKNVHLLK